MKLEDLKEGQKITHYVCGELVEATVIQRSGTSVCTRHKPIRWGNQYFIETWINPSNYLQFKWGGKPAQGPHTTPCIL